MTPLEIRIVGLRGELGWTQEDLARESGVSRVTIARIEAGGNKRVDLDILEKLARALKVTPGSLIQERGARGRGKR